VIFEQLVNPDLGCASYLIGCEAAGEVVLVDPHLEIEPLLAAAERHGARIVRIIETHTHADHVSGHGRLALEHGIPVSIHPIAAVAYPNDPLEDGDEIRVGQVSLRCLHTPGHRPEHCCFAVVDHTRADEPWLVLTGDSLFVGDTARPDLAVGGVEGATGLHASLQRLVALGDGVEVYPGHVSGSLCGRGMSSKASTTIGFERRFNPMLQLASVEAFVRVSAGIEAPKPPNLVRIVAANHGPFRPAPPEAQELAAPPAGQQILDVRPFADYAAGHHEGAVNVPVAGSSFATRAGFALDPDRPVCVVAASAADARRALAGLHSVALQAPGYVIGGGRRRMEATSAGELAALVAAGTVDVVDVREPHEHAEGHIPGAENVPYHLLATIFDRPRDRPLVTICESGPRAAVAASILAAHGLDARPVTPGGMGAWRAEGHPVETGAPAAVS